MALAVRVDGEVRRMPARVGLVVADHQPRLGAQRSQHRHREPWVAVPEDAAVPGPRLPAEDVGEAVDRDQRRRPTGRGAGLPERRGERGVIRREDLARTLRPLRRVEPQVPRDPVAVTDLDDAGRVVEAAVAVDDQARETRAHHGQAEVAGERLGQRAGAEVPGNVAGELRLAETQVAQCPGHRAAGMVAGDHRRETTAEGPLGDGGRVVRAQQACRLGGAVGGSLGETQCSDRPGRRCPILD
jgi:hypothetical protein